MIEEQTAVAIATRFLKAKDVDVEGFAEARYVPEEKIWACCFFNKPLVNGVDSPGMTIVDVNGMTGDPSFFETL